MVCIGEKRNSIITKGCKLDVLQKPKGNKNIAGEFTKVMQECMRIKVVFYPHYFKFIEHMKNSRKQQI